MSGKLYYLVSPANTLPLSLDKHVYFGRGEGNTVIVNDLRASRQHAELFWDGNSFVLIDLSSSNGTFVNGSRISTHMLQDGDEIQIGLLVYVFRVLEPAGDMSEAMKKLEHDTRKMATSEMPALQCDLPAHDFSGVIGQVTLGEICQMLELGRRSGQLLLAPPGQGPKGVLFFQEGEIVSAQCAGLAGEEAAYKLLQMRHGSFSFRSGHPVPPRTISVRTSALLLEAARRGDELAQ